MRREGEAARGDALRLDALLRLVKRVLLTRTEPLLPEDGLLKEIERRSWGGESWKQSPKERFKDGERGSSSLLDFEPDVELAEYQRLVMLLVE